MTHGGNSRRGSGTLAAPVSSATRRLAVFTPRHAGHVYGGAGERYPALMDRGGSPDVGNGGQLTYIARHAGEHTIGVRSRSGAACSTYYLGVTRMRADTGSQIPPSTNF